MKVLFFAVAVSMFVLSGQVAQAAIVARDDFDAPRSLISYSAIDAEGNDPTNTGVWSSPRDNFGPRSLADFPAGGPTGNFLSEAVVDNSVADPTDMVGILTPDYPGNFFAVVDTDNGLNPSGVVTGTWVFDISGAGELSELSIDMAAMGGFFDNDQGLFEQFTWAYSIDGGPETDAIFLRADASQGAIDYTLANGNVVNYGTLGRDSREIYPMTANGVLLTNELQTITAPLSGSGSQLTLTLNGFVNDNDGPIVFDNIIISSASPAGVIPEPCSALLWGIPAGAALLLRRRRGS